MAEEEHVRAMWNDLGVGQSGFLTLAELGRVCEHIGMIDFGNDDVLQLFENLDVDRDGLVSFDEFTRCLFQQLLSSSASSNFVPLDNLGLQSTALGNIFSQIDCGGFATGPSVVSYWKKLGLSDGIEVLRHLQFDPNGRVSLAELSYVLDVELSSDNKLIKDDVLLLVAALSFKSEVYYCKKRIDELTQECDKLRADLTVERNRLNLLAQEGDCGLRATEEHRLRELTNLERHYQEQIHSLSKNVDLERNHFQMQLLMQQKSMETLTEQDAFLKAHFSKLTQETSRLERELLDAEKLNARQRLELDAAADLHVKMTEEVNNLRKCQGKNLDSPSVKELLQEPVKVKKLLKDENLSQEHERKVAMLNVMESELADCHKQLNQFQSELQLKIKEISDLNSKLTANHNESETRVALLEQEKQQLQEVNDRTTQALHHSTRQMRENLADVEELKKVKKNLKLDNDKLKITNEQLQKKKIMDERKLFEREMDVKGLQNDNIMLEAQKEDLNRMVQDLEAKLRVQQTDLNTFKMNYEKLCQSLKQQEKNVVQKQRDLEEKKKIIQTFNEEKLKLNEVKKDEVTKLNDTIKELYEQIVDLKRECDWLKKQRRTFQLQLDQMKLNMDDQVKEIVLQKDTINCLTLNLANANENKEKTYEIVQLQKELEVLKDSSYKMQSEKNHISMQKDDLEQEKKQFSKELHDVKNQINLIQNENRLLRNEVNDVKKSLEGEVERLKLGIEKATLESDKITRNLNIKTKECAAKQTEYESLKEIFRQSQIELSRIQHQLEKNTSEFEKKNCDLNKFQINNKTLVAEKYELESKNYEFEQQCNEKINKYNDLKILYDIVCVDNSQLEITMGNYKDKLYNLENQSTQLERDIHNLQKLNGDFQLNIEELNMKNIALDNKLLNLQKENEKLHVIEEKFNIVNVEVELKIKELKDKDIKFDILVEENKKMCDDLNFKNQQVEQLQVANDLVRSLLDEKIGNFNEEYEEQQEDLNDIDQFKGEKETLKRINLSAQRDLLNAQQRCDVLQLNLEREKNLQCQWKNKLSEVSLQNELKEKQITEMKRFISQLDDAYKDKEASQVLQWNKLNEERQADKHHFESEIQLLKIELEKTQMSAMDFKMETSCGVNRAQLDVLEQKLTEARVKLREYEQLLELNDAAKNEPSHFTNDVAEKFERTRLLLDEQTKKLKVQIEKNNKHKHIIKELLYEKSILTKRLESAEQSGNIIDGFGHSVKK